MNDDPTQYVRNGVASLSSDYWVGRLADADCWEERLARVGWPRWVMHMTLRAIADMLEPEVKIPDQPKSLRRYRMEKAADRADAFRWIFNDDDDEVNFSAVCKMLGVPVTKARERILLLRLANESIPGLQGRSRSK